MTDEKISEAIAEAEMDILGMKLKVYVLDNGQRVIEQSDMMRFLTMMTSAYTDLEICETCSKPLGSGDLVHRCDDGPVLCEECAPTYNDIRREYDAAKAEGRFETMFQFPEDAAENDRDLDAVIAAGDGDKKNVAPL